LKKQKNAKSFLKVPKVCHRGKKRQKIWLLSQIMPQNI